MSPQEREELEAEACAREDYRSEAFGDEARLLEAQGRDEHANGMGFTSWAGYQRALREHEVRARASRSIRLGKESRGFRLPVNPDNDVPF